MDSFSIFSVSLYTLLNFPVFLRFFSSYYSFLLLPPFSTFSLLQILLFVCDQIHLITHFFLFPIPCITFSSKYALFLPSLIPHFVPPTHFILFLSLTFHCAPSVYMLYFPVFLIVFYSSFVFFFVADCFPPLFQGHRPEFLIIVSIKFLLLLPAEIHVNLSVM